MTGLIVCVALVVFAWLFLLRKVRSHQAEEVETPESRYVEIREAVLRADEATVPERERVENPQLWLYRAGTCARHTF
jgi:hypothetical protein